MPNVNRWKPPQRNGKKRPMLRFINKNAKNLPYGWTEPKSNRSNRSKGRKGTKGSKKKAKGSKVKTRRKKFNLNNELNKELNKIK
jgi:hypothetical protein